MKEFRVSFFKVDKESVLDEDTGKRSVNKTDEFLGSIVIDDFGTGPDFPLAAKAYRHAPSSYTRGSKVIIKPL